MNKKIMTSYALVQMLGNRIKQYRLDSSMTQKELAEKSGVSVRSIQGFENGKDVTLQNFCKILNALDLTDNLDLVVPDVLKRPSAFLDAEKNKKRMRARKKSLAEHRHTPFKWGDEWDGDSRND